MILVSMIAVIAVSGILVYAGEKIGGSAGDVLCKLSMICFLGGIFAVLFIFAGDGNSGLEPQDFWRSGRR